MLECRFLGSVPYRQAWQLQQEIHRRIANREHNPTVLLLEHPPVFTLGKNGDAANVLDPGDIPVKRVDRGGDVTYHGPGQLVGYPLLDVRALGVRRYVRSLEDSLLGLLEGMGVAARRKEGCVGLWAERGKIASIGVRVARGVSMHGFALNVSNDLQPFTRINPCGMPGCAVTSVSLELGREAEVPEAAGRFRLRFGRRVLKS